jgi:hypothetical protein
MIGSHRHAIERCRFLHSTRDDAVVGHPLDTVEDQISKADIDDAFPTFVRQDWRCFPATIFDECSEPTPHRFPLPARVVHELDVRVGVLELAIGGEPRLRIGDGAAGR